MTSESGMSSYRKLIPKHTQAGLDAYVLRGTMPGEFLCAVLTNDLLRAVSAADSQNLKALKHIAQFVYNCCPPGCRGAMYQVENWCGHGGIGADNRYNYEPLVVSFTMLGIKPGGVKTVKEAVAWLRGHWNRAAYREILETPLVQLHGSAGKWIRNNMGLWLDNTALLEDCEKYRQGPRSLEPDLGVTYTEDGRLHPDVASGIILAELKKVLEAERGK